MKCIKCSQKAVFNSPSLCAKHFIQYFETKVFKTIKKFNLIKKDDKICVATSGGKDSLTVLYLTKKYLETKLKQSTSKKNIQALIIDEGIGDYRSHTLEDLNLFCKQHNIFLNIISFKKEFSKSLDQLIKNKAFKHLKPCNICGVLRRYLLNKYSKGFDKLVIGHNLDDEAQVIMMNFFRAQVELQAKLGPMTGIIKSKLFTQRIKPLYFCSEKEVMTYSIIKNFTTRFTQCPHVTHSYRAQVRDFLNTLELSEPGSKQNIIDNFIKILPKFKQTFKSTESVLACKLCKEPSKNPVCNACNLINLIKK